MLIVVPILSSLSPAYAKHILVVLTLSSLGLYYWLSICLEYTSHMQGLEGRVGTTKSISLVYAEHLLRVILTYILALKYTKRYINCLVHTPF
jgi:hypothetical protein